MLLSAFQDMTLFHMTLESFPVLCKGFEYSETQDYEVAKTQPIRLTSYCTIDEF